MTPPTAEAETVAARASPPVLMQAVAPALMLMVASGFAGLGYQIVWTQQAALWLGHESAAVLAVVAAFFGGLALGALAFSGRIERSARPGRWYAGFEAIIAGWAGLLVVLMPPASAALLDFTGAQPTAAWQWTVAFGGSFVLLLPATAAMGATLPAMERVLAPWRHRGRVVAALYASNTLGAVIGVLAAAFWLVPEFGLARTAGLCALLNAGCAAAAWMMLGRQPRVVAQAVPPMPSSQTAPTAATAPTTQAAQASRAALPASHDVAAAPADLPTPAASVARAPGLASAKTRDRLLWLLAATGLLGIGYEVLVVRVISQVAEDTVYTFALLLAVYLVGTALGAAGYERFAARVADAAGLQDKLLQTLAAACLAGTASLWGAEAARDAVLGTLGAGMPAALAAEAALAALAFLLPTVAMGALFSHLVTQARGQGIAFGRALGVNTLGAAAAALMFGVLLVPAAGPKGALLMVAAGYLALTAGPSWLNPKRPLPWVLAAAVAALALVAPPLAFVDVPEGGRIVRYEEGAMAAVSVVEDAQGVSRLRINNRQQEGSSASALADGRQALLPLLLHPAPQRALFLGLGTGVTAGTAAQDPKLLVEAVELLPEVIAASAEFAGVLGDERGAGGVGGASRLRLLAADARRHVRTTATRYDVIVADNFHPARSGSGSLYTVEHFRAVRQRLAAGGLFCQWLPLHQLDLPTLRVIVRSFLEAYPGGWAVLATNSLETPTLGLIGRAGDGLFSLAEAQQRVVASGGPRPPADYGFADANAVLGSFIAGPPTLRQFAAGAALNTDDRPVVAYRAPRVTYAPDSTPADRLMALLAALRIAPGEVVDAVADPAGAARLAAYWAARDGFLQAGRGIRPSGDVRAMLAQVREPLLGVLRTSPDFRPAYDPLLRLAVALHRSDAAAARELLAALVRAAPLRPEAGLAITQLEAQAQHVKP